MTQGLPEGTIKRRPLPLSARPAPASVTAETCSTGYLLSSSALLPPTPPSGSSKIGACGPGRGRLPQPPGPPSAAPGVMAAPLLRRNSISRNKLGFEKSRCRIA